MNYWKTKTDELHKILDERGIILDEDDLKNRKFIINAITLDDLDQGNTGKVFIMNEKDEIVEMGENNIAAPIPGEAKNKVQGFKPDPDDPYKGLKMMRCIFRHREEGEPGYESIGSNGRTFYIPKDIEVVVPLYLKAVIQTSIMDRMESVTQPDGSIAQKFTPVPRISWEFRGEVEGNENRVMSLTINRGVKSRANEITRQGFSTE